MMPDGSCSMKTEAMTSWANEKIDPVKSCGDHISDCLVKGPTAGGVWSYSVSLTSKIFSMAKPSTLFRCVLSIT
jgi:hypothetical protein